MLATIGWLILALLLLWGSACIYFVCTNTFTGGLLSGDWYEKLVGVCLIVSVTWLWYLWLGVPNV